MNEIIGFRDFPFFTSLFSIAVGILAGWLGNKEWTKRQERKKGKLQ